MSVCIQPARERQIPEIQSVARKAWKKCYDHILEPEEIERALSEWYSEAALRSSIESDASTLLVATGRGSLLGFGEWGDRGLGPEIFRLYVHPEQWRRGIGTRLCQRLEESMRARGAASCLLFVHPENERGLSFWRDRGFERHADRDPADSPEICLQKSLSRP